MMILLLYCTKVLILSIHCPQNPYLMIDKSNKADYSTMPKVLLSTYIEIFHGMYHTHTVLVIIHTYSCFPFRSSVLKRRVIKIEGLVAASSG